MFTFLSLLGSFFFFKYHVFLFIFYYYFKKNRMLSLVSAKGLRSEMPFMFQMCKMKIGMLIIPITIKDSAFLKREKQDKTKVINLQVACESFTQAKEKGKIQRINLEKYILLKLKTQPALQKAESLIQL